MKDFIEFIYDNKAQIDNLNASLNLLLISLPVFLISYLRLWKERRKFKRSKILFLTNIASFIISFFLLAIIVGNPQIYKSTANSSAVALIDVSDSMDESTAEHLLSRLEILLSSVKDLYIYPFAGKTSNQPLTTFPKSYRELKNEFQNLDFGNSDLSQAWYQAVKHGNVDTFLISDGWENSGSIAGVIGASEGRIFPLLPLASENTIDQKLALAQVQAQNIVDAGQVTNIYSTIRNQSDTKEKFRLVLLNGEEVISQETLSLAPNSEQAFPLKSNPIKEGAHKYRVELHRESGELISQDSLFISGIPEDKLLIFSDNPAQDHYLKLMLESHSKKADFAYASDGSSKSHFDFENYFAVIYNNIAKVDLENSSSSRIRNYVEQGGNFIMIGGNKSFGLGNYANTPVAEVLPVEIIPPERTTKRLNVAVTLLLDKSGSMRQQQKLDFSKLAAREVVRNLKDDDYISIIGIDDAPFIIQKMTKVSLARLEADRKIGLLFSVGGTNFLPGLDIAKRDMERIEAGRKHVILLTDGKLPDGYVMRNEYLRLVKEMRYSGVTLSTFLVGSEQGDLLVDMAKTGGGAFHRTYDANNLPKLFLEDVRVSTGERTQKESLEYRVAPESRNSILSTRLTSFPNILGYTKTIRRPKANLELIVESPGETDPLLASWKYGKGKTLAFTSDVTPRWGRFWLEWSKFGMFWMDILESLHNQDETNIKRTPLEMRSELNGDTLNIFVSIYANSAPTNLKFEIKRPDQRIEAPEFETIAPGYYKLTLKDAGAGDYFLKTSINNTSLTELALNLSGELFGEIKGKGFNTSLLTNLAELSTGGLNPHSANYQTSENVIEVDKSDISYLFIILCLFSILIQILSRERIRSLA